MEILPCKAGWVIEARGLSKRFGNVVAVDDLSFDVRPGSVTGFLGPNGSGKSTTMRMIMALDSPDVGLGDRVGPALSRAPVAHA